MWPTCGAHSLASCPHPRSPYGVAARWDLLVRTPILQKRCEPDTEIVISPVTTCDHRDSVSLLASSSESTGPSINVRPSTPLDHHIVVAKPSASITVSVETGRENKCHRRQPSRFPAKRPRWRVKEILSIARWTPLGAPWEKNGQGTPNRSSGCCIAADPCAVVGIRPR